MSPPPDAAAPPEGDAHQTPARGLNAEDSDLLDHVIETGTLPACRVFDPEILDMLIGHQLPGGCEHCNAYQTIKRWPGIPIVDDGPGAWVNSIHHDDDCPDWLRRQNRAARRAAVKRARRKRSDL